MNVTIKPIADYQMWEDFMAGHEEGNFLHSWQWGDFHAELGQQIFRDGLYKGGKLVGLMLSVVEDAKRGRYLTIPGGPILDWSDEVVVKAAVGRMRSIARNNRCVFVRVRPQLTDSPEAWRQFKSLGFRPAPMHLHAELTSQLDLNASEEELLAKMRKTTRYEIRQADKKGITVSHSTDVKRLKEFYNLQIETAKRQGFVPFSYEFLRRQFAVFAGRDQVLLYRAELDGEILAEAYVIFYGPEAAYHYGASTESGRRLPGAYAIQWEAIREAKRRGMSRYNFWGVVEPDETSHRFYGVSVFKRGFGGTDVAYLHAQDLVIDKLGYLKNWIVETFRRKWRRV